MKLKPPQAVALSFFLAIVIGTLLLSLPVAQGAKGGISLVDRIFTATSATCVTGLIVRDTPHDWSPFGQTVIFLLFQAGGLGIMTLSTFFAVILGRRLTLREYDVIQGALDHTRGYRAKRLIKYIIGLTVAVELIGASLLFLRWSYTETWPMQERLAKSVFHSVSAFCNAGFSLFSNSFMDFKGDIYINLIMIFLIFLGGIGFVVILDVIKGIFSKRTYRKPRISLQSKIVLTTSLVLIIAGAGLIFFLESGNTMKAMPFKDKLLGSAFQSVTSRTAGFNTLPVSKLAPGTLVLLVFLMFIGASPGSTGGGIKTCTFAVVVATAWTMSKNRGKVFMFGRTIPRTIVRRAILIFILAVGWILLATFLFIIFEKNNLGTKDLVIRSLFEVTSAFGTVGLTTGVTPGLTALGKILITVTMFIGRIGPLTMALAIAIREEKLVFSYPEEKLMVG
ncbi:MAG: Trk family potassium uptake protein [Candidatus Omnitrophica bacterium]|nr:Trk family potassium uptake protein [Candidatus Omnitrophota bacterium]